MPDFQVNVVIENKPGISDPEGDTILNDLVLKGKTKIFQKFVLEQSSNSQSLKTMKTLQKMK